MNTLIISTIVWGCFAAAFIALLIYRGYLGQHETDQLFLSEVAPSPTHIENDEVLRRFHSIEPIFRGVSIATGLMTLLVACMWITRLMADTHLI
jgi:hypothetical protein